MSFSHYRSYTYRCPACALDNAPTERHSILASRTVSATVSDVCLPLQAAGLTLGVDTDELGDDSASFNQLGGDSLAAIQFAREVDELCGTTLPVSFVLDHSHSMKDIVEKVLFDRPIQSMVLRHGNALRGARMQG